MAIGKFHLLFSSDYSPMKLGCKGLVSYVFFLSCQYDSSCKIVSAFLESPDMKVQKLVEKELKPLIDRGVLKNPKLKEQANQ